MSSMTKNGIEQPPLPFGKGGHDPIIACQTGEAVFVPPLCGLGKAALRGLFRHVQDLDNHCGCPCELIAATWFARDRIIIFRKPAGFDQAQAVIINARGNIGLPCHMKTICNHIVDDQPHWSTPIPFCIKIGVKRIMACHKEITILRLFIQRICNRGRAMAGDRGKRSQKSLQLWCKIGASADQSSKRTTIPDRHHFAAIQTEDSGNHRQPQIIPYASVKMSKHAPYQTERRSHFAFCWEVADRGTA